MSSPALFVPYLTNSPSPRSYKTLRKVASFYVEELLAQQQTAMLEYHPLPAVLFSSIRNMGTRHAVVTRVHLSRAYSKEHIKSMNNTCGKNGYILRVKADSTTIQQYLKVTGMEKRFSNCSYTKRRNNLQEYHVYLVLVLRGVLISS